MNGWYLVALPIAYLLLIALAAGVLYLVLRFAIRDGLRGHRLWLERRTTGATDPQPAAPARTD